MRTDEFLIILGIIILGVLGYLILSNQYNDETDCQREPLEFAVKEYSNRVKSPLSCDCYFQNNMLISPFTVNITGLTYTKNNTYNWDEDAVINVSEILGKALGNSS